MPAKKISHSLHMRINELLDQILEKENQQNLENGTQQKSQPELNLGDPDQPLLVSMESFFEFNFELSQEVNRWVDESNEESMLDSHQREWDIFEQGNRIPGFNSDPTEFALPKQPR